MSGNTLSLNEESGFNRLVEYYEKHLSKPWYEWLKVVTTFPRPGKQGLVGLMTDKNEEDGIVYVFKVSQYINYLVQHEFAIMKSLNSVSNFCPHFCKAVGGLICEVDPNSRKEGNPFEMNSQYIIEKEVLLMEYVEKSTKFYNYIRSKKIDENILYSAVKQTLLAILIAQKKKKFSHYDLHSNNIMMKKCDKNLVFLYVINEDNQFCVSTNGYYPVIIDFGFSYSEDLDNGPLWPSLGHTEVGFMSSEFDPIADPKLFLVTVSGEIKDKRKSKRSKKLVNIVKNTFGSLNIDWVSGWDQDTDTSVVDYILADLEEYNDESPLFKEYEHYCIDILQTLIILPLEKQKTDTFHESYIAFLHEFAKIEHEISTPFYCLYILKGIVDSARTVRVDYYKKESRKHAIDFFRISLHERINSVVKFCRPKNIHYERMLCSLLLLAKGMEGMFYNLVKDRMNYKSKQYEKLPLKSIEEICSVIEINIEDEYQFNEKTSVMIIDAQNERCHTVDVDDEIIQEMNSIETVCRGPELYQMLKNKSLIQ